MKRQNDFEANGHVSSVRGGGSLPTLVAVLAILLLLVGCGGNEEARRSYPPPPNSTTEGPTSGAPTGRSAVEADDQDESLEGEAFTLDRGLPVPPRFEAAYQRKAPIVVEFFQKGRDPYYPQGLEVDEMVNNDLVALRDEYPQIEFFTYDTDTPGDAATSEDLERGEYGSLAAQLEVGYTPFVAMLAPREEGYVVEHVFQGYVDQAVLDQELFELANTYVEGDPSGAGQAQS
ncbi:MAG: hypothetical protein M3N45_05995 [Actinomycetota bacterium]|nr:hypothetical protein [Actinomycetota bacterium]